MSESVNKEVLNEALFGDGPVSAADELSIIENEPLDVLVWLASSTHLSEEAQLKLFSLNLEEIDSVLTSRDNLSRSIVSALWGRLKGSNDVKKKLHALRRLLASSPHVPLSDIEELLSQPALLISASQLGNVTSWKKCYHTPIILTKLLDALVSLREREASALSTYYVLQEIVNLLPEATKPLQLESLKASPLHMGLCLPLAPAAMIMEAFTDLSAEKVQALSANPALSDDQYAALSHFRESHLLLGINSKLQLNDKYSLAFLKGMARMPDIRLASAAEEIFRQLREEVGEEYYEALFEGFEGSPRDLCEAIKILEKTD